MANLCITEYNDIAYSASSDSTNSTLQEPSIATQNVAIAAGHAESSAFSNRTRFVRLFTDTACAVKFGTAPVAATTDMRLAANTDITLGVPMGAGFKVSTLT